MPSRIRKAGVWVETVARGRMGYDKIGRLLLTLEGEGGNEQLLDTARNVLTKHLKMAGEQGQPHDYELMLKYSREQVRASATAKLLARHLDQEVPQGLPLTTDLPCKASISNPGMLSNSR